MFLIFIVSYVKSLNVISVIVCVYNREQYILKCLESVASQSFNRNGYELIVINNNSTDRSEHCCRKFEEEHPDLHFSYMVESQQGVSHARNRGIDVARGDIIAFIDDDSFIGKEFLTVVSRFFQDHPDVNMAGGKIQLVFEADKPGWLSPFLIPLLGQLDLGKRIKRFPPHKYPFGSNLCVRRDFIKEKGGFNTKLGRKGNILESGEEKDLAWRVRRSGDTIFYIPQAVVYHHVSQEKITKEYIRKLATGIGYSERIRVIALGKIEVTRKIVSEAFKWCASSLLLLYYLFTFRPAKGFMIIRFRYWINKGILRNLYI